MWSEVQYNILKKGELLSIYFTSFDYLFASNTRQNGWADQEQILCMTVNVPRDISSFKVSKFQKFASNKIWFTSILRYTERKCLQLKKKMDVKRPKSLVAYKPLYSFKNAFLRNRNMSQSYKIIKHRKLPY